MEITLPITGKNDNTGEYGMNEERIEGSMDMMNHTGSELYNLIIPPASSNEITEPVDTNQTNMEWGALFDNFGENEIGEEEIMDNSWCMFSQEESEMYNAILSQNSTLEFTLPVDSNENDMELSVLHDERDENDNTGENIDLLAQAMTEAGLVSLILPPISE